MAYIAPSASAVHFTIPDDYVPPGAEAISFYIDNGTTFSTGRVNPELPIVEALGSSTIVCNGDYTPLIPNISGVGYPEFSFGRITPLPPIISALGTVTLLANGAYSPPLVTILGADTVPNAWFYPRLPTIKGSAVSQVSIGFIAPVVPEIIATGTNAIIGTGRFRAPKIVCKSIGYSGELVSSGQYLPVLPVVEAQGVTGVYGWGLFTPKVPTVRGAGTATELTPATIGIGRYRPPTPVVSGLSLAPATGAIRFSPPKTYISAFGSRSCHGDGVFFPFLPRVKGQGSSGAGVQEVLSFFHESAGANPTLPGADPTVLGYDRDPVTPGTTPSTPPTPLSFLR